VQRATTLEDYVFFLIILFNLNPEWFYTASRGIFLIFFCLSAEQHANGNVGITAQ